MDPIMSKTEEIKAQFEERLEKQKQVRANRLEADLQILRAGLLRGFHAALPVDLRQQTEAVAAGFPSQLAFSPAQPLLDMASSSQLQQLDDAFIKMFHLDTYYPVSRLNYPTVYCETLEEFFAPLVAQLDLSPEGRQAELSQLVAQAQEQARPHGGGMFGYNLPGKGAYLNGWLFAYKQGFSPREAFNRPEALRRILETATHEKLGHGFLSVYSALGEVKSRLGLTQMDLARKFGLRTADDPTASLRREQANLLFLASQLLEEGWATWVETYLASSLFRSGTHPRGNLQKVVDAINGLPSNLPERQEIQQSLLGAILLLFGEKDAPLEMLHQAVLILQMVGGQLDELLVPKLGQPLRYLIGELLHTQAGANLGPLCVPYAALIASGVTFDPAQVGLSDLRDLLSRDPRLNPDARMAAISRLRLEKKDDVRGMANIVAAQLSFSIPKELQ
jgi:hypothetical protein